MTSDDKETIEGLIKDIDELLATDNLTVQEREALEITKAKVEELIDIISKSNEDTDTGDDSHLMMWSWLMIASVYMFTKIRKKEME